MRKSLLPLLLLSLAAAPALAQVPTVPATPAVPQTGSVGNTGRSLPTLPPPAVPAYPNGYTDKHVPGSASPSTTFPNGLPDRNLDNGTGRNDQPRAGQAQPGAQPTRSIFRGSKRRSQQ